MFLRRYQRNKQGKLHTYYALVESVPTNARQFGDVWLARWLGQYLGLDTSAGMCPKARRRCGPPTS